MPEFQFQEMFPTAADTTPYRKLSADFVGTTKFGGRDVLTVEPEALTLLTAQAFKDISHLLRPGHLAQLRRKRRHDAERLGLDRVRRARRDRRDRRDGDGRSSSRFERRHSASWQTTSMLCPSGPMTNAA